MQRPDAALLSVAILCLSAGSYLLLFRPAENIHWIDEAVLHNGKIVDVHRAAVFSHKRQGTLEKLIGNTPKYFLTVTHPGTGKVINWKGEYGFNPILLDFSNGDPYLVILGFHINANLKQYGCPDIPYIFFRYDTNTEQWAQISGAAFPAGLSRANLRVNFYGGWTKTIEEGLRVTKKNISEDNEAAEGAGTGGYFTNTIPRDFNSWTYKQKNEFKKDHGHDGCRPA